MVRVFLFSTSSLVLAAMGCLCQDSQTALAPANPFAQAPAASATQVAYAPASEGIAARVDTVGRQVIEANKQIGVRPVFRTIGAPQPEIFHQGIVEIDITEGLAKQCVTDAQLAAVLCHELGKMVAERELLAGPQARKPEARPPMEVRVGNDNAGLFGPADQTHLAELARYDRDRQRAPAPPPPPDPRNLARSYLIKAGYAPTDLDTALPVIEAASQNTTFVRQLKPPAQPARPWTGR